VPANRDRTVFLCLVGGVWSGTTPERAETDALGLERLNKSVVDAGQAGNKNPNKKREKNPHEHVSDTESLSRHYLTMESLRF